MHKRGVIESTTVSSAREQRICKQQEGTRFEIADRTKHHYRDTVGCDIDSIRASSAPSIVHPARLALYSPLRGQLDGSECSILGRIADGSVFPRNVRVAANWAAQEAQVVLHQSLGNSRPLARLGTDAGWDPRILLSRVESMAKHSPSLRVVIRREHGS